MLMAPNLNWALKTAPFLAPELVSNPDKDIGRWAYLYH
jgi:hypothetical protein